MEARIRHQAVPRRRDTERAISDLARQGIPGWDVMRDQWHLKPSLFDAEARQVLLLARRAVGPDKPLELSDSTEPWPSRRKKAATGASR